MPTAEGRADQDEIHVGEGADEGEQDQEADGEGGAQCGIGEMAEPRLERLLMLHVRLPHRRRALDAEPDQHRARQIEDGEHPEVGGEAEMVDQARSHQAAEQVGGDVAGDVGGKGAGGVGGTGVLAEIGKRQREGGRHAKALQDAQQGEQRQVRHGRQQRRRDRQQRQAEQDAAPAIEPAAEQGNGQAADRHADGAGVDGEAHGRRRHPVGGGERRQDGLRREQIDDGEKGGDADRERAQGT